MTEVPHSGNYCSGLCRTPCDHPDCWQCSEYKDLHPEGAAKVALNQNVNKNGYFDRPSSMSHSNRQRLQAEFEKAKQEEALREKARAAELNRRQAEGSILSGMGAQREMDQKTVITRAALEALCERAGVRMDWNGGDPVFYADDIATRAEAIQRTLTEERVKTLSDIASRLGPNDILTGRVANTMAKAASESIDKMVSETLRSKTDDLLRHDAEENERQAIEKLKANGASDADIEAAKELLGWDKPLQFAEPQAATTTFSKEAMRRMMKTLEANLISPSTVIMHPSMLDKE